jgi:hypothetical protein
MIIEIINQIIYYIDLEQKLCRSQEKKTLKD